MNLLPTSAPTTTREVALLQEATDMILSSTDVDRVLHQILLIVRNHFAAMQCAVYLVEPGTRDLYVRAQIGYNACALPGGRVRIGEQGITGWAAHARFPVYVPDVRKEPRYIEVDPNTRSELAVPLLVRDEVVGVLDVISDKLDSFSDEMLGLLALFGGQAAIAIENARLYSSERRRMRQIHLLNLLARSAASAMELNSFLDSVAELVSDSFEASEIFVLLTNPDRVLSLRAHAASHGESSPELRTSAFCDPAQTGSIGRCLSARKLFYASNAQLEMIVPAHEGSCSELALPLIATGDVLGAVLITHPAPGAFSADDCSIAQAAADVCATAIRNLQAGGELRRVTGSGPLT